MTPTDFAAFLSLCKERHGWGSLEVADRLGIAKNLPTKYKKPGAKIPDYIPVACAAVAAGLEPWAAPVPPSHRRAD